MKKNCPIRIVVAVVLLCVIWTRTNAQLTEEPNARMAASPHSFALGDSSFLLDGQPLQMISGEMHYTRVPREYWRDRMKMAKAMGLNTIGTYVFWNTHEAERGKFDFTGNNDIAAFVQTAREEGLWVVLRPSPYVCAEWEFGGYPWWLLKDSTLKVRSRDPRFLEAYRTYINQLARQLVPLLVTHGGNILMVQMENEYGSYSDDKSYLDLNRQLFREAGFDGILFTCDGATQMPKGYLPGYLPAVNGEENPASIKTLINKYHDGKGPYYLAEWYPGWFDDWGKPHAHTNIEQSAATLDKILSAGISINMYMFHGGSTRGFMNGANMNRRNPYSPQVSSYDYDAPLDEAGNPTEKYFAFRKVIERHLPPGRDLPPVPEKKIAVGIAPIQLTAFAPLFGNLPAPVASDRPLCFEDLGQAYGFVLYRTHLHKGAGGILKIKELRDYAIIYVRGHREAILDRRLRQDSTTLGALADDAELDILVENNGRINYGPFLADNRQGITQSVTFNGEELHGWKMYRLPFSGMEGMKFKIAATVGAAEGQNSPGAGEQPGLYKGVFSLNELHDTYLDMRGFGKGFVFLNGHNLGKYWGIGPQQTIYVPAGWLRKGANEVVVFDALKGDHATLPTLSAPILNSVQLVSARSDARYPLIPYPASLIPSDGEFVIADSTPLLTFHPEFEQAATMLANLFTGYFGQPLKWKLSQTPPPSILLAYDYNIKEEEGYVLKITPGGVMLSARTTAGIFLGVQTIRQLLPVAGAESAGGAVSASAGRVARVVLPCVEIHDAPAYSWRGMHLDVSRHFFSIDYLKKFIDVMALYKMNKFHLHLTDDQGWRIEIKKFPSLTSVGAWRTFNKQDSACMRLAADDPDFIIDPTHIVQKEGKTLYGGFYTQEEMKGLVAYATARHIDIIPEIDMPGHMMAAIDQYNWLSCDGKSAFGALFSTPICPCLPTTFQFAQDVYSEIMDIFPSKYIHIGGDEVDRSLWGKSEECKALMLKEGIKDLAGLQSYFIDKMEKFFNSKGRKMIGWDEVLEGGVSKTAVIMYWRTWVPKSPVEAARNGNSVIMVPGTPLYFSTNPDKNSLPAVFNFNPVPKGLSANEAGNIIGAQGAIWTETIPTEARADYMYMPRMTALAEVLWTGPVASTYPRLASGSQDELSHHSYQSYLRRLHSQYGRLDAMQVHYRLPDLDGFFSSNVFVDRDSFWVKPPLNDLTIRYTKDSTAPTLQSPILSAPVIIRQPQTIRMAIFRPNGTRGDVYTLQYSRQDLAEAAIAAPEGEGLICSQYKGHYRMTTRMPDRKPDTVVTVHSIEVPPALEAPSFGLKYRGWLDIPQDGVYGFYLVCDDGGVLRIADREVVNNDGNHPPLEKNGQVALRKGLQRLALDFIEGGGGYTLQLKYSLNGSEPQPVPSNWLKH